MAYEGDIRLGDTIDMKFTTVQSTGAPITLAGSPVISAYPANSTTQLTAGITLSVDFDGVTGLHNVRVVATGGNGYLTATNYTLVITTGTINGVSAVGYVVGSFSIENRSALMPTTAARTLDVTATGGAGIDWANVEAPTTALALTGTTIAVTQKVDVDTIKTNPVVNGGTATFPTNATLASTTNITAGTVTTATNVTTVNGLAANVITAASIAADAITAAKIADAAIDAATFAAGAINAAAIAADAITAAKIADGAIDAATFAAGAINAAAIAADAITDAKVAADVTIASVTGAVGSVTGAVGSVTAGVTVTTNNDKTGYSVASGGIGSGAHAAAELNAIADAHLDRNMATGTDTGTDSTVTRTPRQALRRLRNKESIAAGVLTVTKENDVTASWTAAVATTAGDPLSSVDPT